MGRKKKVPNTRKKILQLSSETKKPEGNILGSCFPIPHAYFSVHNTCVGKTCTFKGVFDICVDFAATSSPKEVFEFYRLSSEHAQRQRPLACSCLFSSVRVRPLTPVYEDSIYNIYIGLRN